MSGERWVDAREALAHVAEQCGKYGADGLDLYFLNDSLESPGLKASLSVRLSDADRLHVSLDCRTAALSSARSRRSTRSVSAWPKDFSSCTCSNVHLAGQTPTGTKLKEILDKYIPLVENKRVPHKPINIIVITDGAASASVEPFSLFSNR